LLDDAAVLACSVYVDLNPIRAEVARTPEESQFTSAFDSTPRPRRAFRPRASDQGFLPIELTKYLSLVDDGFLRSGERSFRPLWIPTRSFAFCELSP
jgi:hypothetical protein